MEAQLLLYQQVWILGPGDLPTAAHELWEDDRMELLVIINDHNNLDNGDKAGGDNGDNILSGE